MNSHHFVERDACSIKTIGADKVLVYGESVMLLTLPNTTEDSVFWAALAFANMTHYMGFTAGKISKAHEIAKALNL